MNRILKEMPDIAIKESYRIAGLRDQIIHGYDSISDENIWAILINHLPTLRIEIEALTKNI